MSIDLPYLPEAESAHNRRNTENALKLAIEQSELVQRIARAALFDRLDQMEIPEVERDRLRVAIVGYVTASVNRAAISGALKAVRTV